MSAGAVDRQQIEDGFRTLSIPAHYKYARELLEACDQNQDGKCDYKEFRGYLDSKELELYQLFREIDLENDGTIYPDDLKRALNKAGINLKNSELHQFVDRIDADNNGIISFKEWRDFLLLYPHEVTMARIYQYWEKECQVDIGEQAVIPEGISRHLSTWKYLCAGGTAGAVSRTATAPLDRLKVLLQVQTAAPKSMGVIGGLTEIYKDSGLVGYFRGNGINIVKVAPEQAIKFYSYEVAKKYIVGIDSHGEPLEEIGTFGRLAAGGMAGATAQTVIYPMDVVKTRLQTHKGGQLGTPQVWKLARTMLAQEGPVAFYRGLTPSLLGMVPYAGIDLAAYEKMRDLAHRYLPDGPNKGHMAQLACGTISGALGATAVYPLQLVRTRLQAQTASSPIQFAGMVDCFRKTWQYEGFWGFYKGLLPNLLKVAPASCITYAVYEEMKRRLDIS
eukprot:jgi/Mesen1/6201/ME000320S05403